MSAGPTGAHAGGGPGAGAPVLGGPGAPGGGAAANSVRRYIDDDAALPYKTRGFYMTVIMDHRKIPSLIAELSASEKSAWPVEILRVQMVRLHDNDIDSRGGGGFGVGGGIGGGAGGIGPGAGGGRPGMGPGAGPPGFPPPGIGGESDPLRDGAINDNPNAASQAAAGAAALDAAMQDPFMARVAICGIITLYKEVKPEAVAPAAQPPVLVPAVPAPAAGTAPQVDPANPAAPAADARQNGPASGTIPAASPAAPVVPAQPAPNGGGTGAVPGATPKLPATSGNG